MRKHKIVIDPRQEVREVEAKASRFGIVDVAVVPDDDTISELVLAADWSDDPGTGRSVLLADGRELVNPVPVAPPAHIAAYAKENSVNDLVQRAIAQHMALLKGSDELDSEDEAEDFPEDVDWHPTTLFEYVLMDDAPAIPGDVDPGAAQEAAAAVAELEAAAGGGGKKKPPKREAAPPPDPEEE